MINNIDINLSKNIVYKEIDKKNDINKKINGYLKKFGYKNPLVDYEVSILKKLERYDIAPKVTEVNKNGYSMTYCGKSLYELGKDWYKKLQDDPLKKEFIHKQIEYILKILKENGIKHNDIYNENILVDKNDKIRVIDFTFASFNGISGIGDLFPDLSLKHDFIYCARYTDETLYQVESIIDWTSMRYNIENNIKLYLPKSKGEMGAHTLEGYIYHQLPFKEIQVPYLREFSMSRINKILNKLPLKSKEGLDIGCSVGAVSFALAMNAKKMTGIDYDVESIKFANKINSHKSYDIEFIQQELNLDYVKNMKYYDFIIWFSNWMWIAKRYGVEEAKKILYEVSQKTDILFFDTAQGGTDKAESYQLNGMEEVKKLLKENTSFDLFENLGLSEESYHQRNVFMCSRSKGLISKLKKYIF